jgi:glycine cleavage system H protein
MLKKDGYHLRSVSRREFLEKAGLMIGGVATSSLTLQSGCAAAKTTTSNTAQPANTTTPPESAAPTTPVSPVTSSTAYKYIPDPTPFELLDVPDCYTKIAADRMYSELHTWVKRVESDVVVLGISDKFSAMLYKPSVLTLLPIGTILARDGVFGDIEGQKMNADLISPVTGKIIDINTFLLGAQMKGIFEPVVGDPYGSGWMTVVQISRLEELNDLLTPLQYLDYSSAISVD